MEINALLVISVALILGLGNYFCQRKGQRAIWATLFITALMWAFLVRTGMDELNASMLFRYRLSFFMESLCLSSLLFFLYQFPKKEQVPTFLKVLLIGAPIFILAIVNSNYLVVELTDHPYKQLNYGPAYYPFATMTMTFLVLIFLRLKKLTRKSSGFEQLKVKSLLQTLYVICGLPLLTNLILPILGMNQFNQIGTLFLPLTVICLYYPFIKYNRRLALMSVQLGVNRLLEGILIGAFIFLTANVMNADLTESVSFLATTIYFLMSMVIVLMYPFLSLWTSRISKKLLFKSRLSFQNMLRELLAIFGALKTKEKLINTMLWSVPLMINKAQLFIFLKSKGDTFEEFSNSENFITEKIQERIIFERLEETKSVIVIDDVLIQQKFSSSASEYNENEAIYDYMKAYKAELAFPIILSGVVSGYILLTKRKKGWFYHDDDLKSLEILINHFSTAMDNITHVEQLSINRNSFLKLNTFVQNVMKSFELRTITQYSTLLFQDLFKAKTSYFFMHSEESDTFSLVNEERDTFFKSEGGSLPEDFFNADSQFYKIEEDENLKEGSHLSELFAIYNTKSIWKIPLYDGETLMGGILVLFEEAPPYFSETENAIAKNFISLIEAAIKSLLLYQKNTAAKAYNEELLKNMAAGIILCDETRKIRSFNKQAEEMTKLVSKDILGKDISLLYEKVPQFSAFNTVLTTKETQVLDIELLHEESRYSYSVQLGPINLSSYSGVIAIITNVTTLKLLQEEIEQTERLGELGMMAAGIAHEIKNPLVAIKTFSQLLPEKWEDRRFRDKYIKLVAPQIDRIYSLCRSLRILGEKKKKTLGYIQVKQLVKSSLEMVRESGAYDHVDIRMDCEGDLSVFVDEDELIQVLFNLVMNGLEAITEDKGCLVVEAGTNKGENKIEIKVKDTGKGMSKEVKSRLFDPFYSTKSKGTGLGMTVVNRIILEHNGDVFVDTEEGKGSCFTVSLPLKSKKKEAVLC